VTEEVRNRYLNNPDNYKPSGNNLPLSQATANNSNVQLFNSEARKK